jgi:hypothetical protein
VKSAAALATLVSISWSDKAVNVFKVSPFAGFIVAMAICEMPSQNAAK